MVLASAAAWASGGGGGGAGRTDGGGADALLSLPPASHAAAPPTGAGAVGNGGAIHGLGAVSGTVTDEAPADEAHNEMASDKNVGNVANSTPGAANSILNRPMTEGVLTRKAKHG